MGPLGVKGSFQKSCEITLRVLQDQKLSLMAILHTLIYHPLAEWKQRSSLGVVHEKVSKKAVENNFKIEQRLKGYVSP